MIISFYFTSVNNMGHTIISQMKKVIQLKKEIFTLCENLVLIQITYLSKVTPKQNQNTKQMRQFHHFYHPTKFQKMRQNGQNWPLCYGNSLCKMLSLSQLKLKKCQKQAKNHFKHNKHIIIVLCKKRPTKRANILKMRRF